MQIKTYRTFLPEQRKFYRNVLNLTLPVKESYPQYVQWYYRTFLKGLQQGERGIVAAFENDALIGVALFKDTLAEKKLCTLFVHPDFRRKGIATQLTKAVVDELGEKPLVSICENNFPQVESLFKKMGFCLSAQIKGAYTPNAMEYYFNDHKTSIIQNGLIPVLLQRAAQLKTVC